MQEKGDDGRLVDVKAVISAFGIPITPISLGSILQEVHRSDGVYGFVVQQWQEKFRDPMASAIGLLHVHIPKSFLDYLVLTALYFAQSSRVDSLLDESIDFTGRTTEFGSGFKRLVVVMICYLAYFGVVMVLWPIMIILRLPAYLAVFCLFIWWLYLRVTSNDDSKWRVKLNDPHSFYRNITREALFIGPFTISIFLWALST